MHIKKRVSIFAVLVVISIIGISIVSASWFSDFLKGELATEKSSAKVQVTGAAFPPEVWFVSKLNGTSGEADPLFAAGASFFKFSFLACSSGGETNLNDASVNASVNGTFGGSKRIVGAACSFVGTVAQLPSTTTCNGLSKNYSCVIKMLYYYDPIVWGINATISDNSVPVKRTSNFTQKFNVAQLTAWSMSPNYVNWSSVASGGPSENSDNNLSITNEGNLDINSAGTYPLYVNATNLMRGAGIENITADKFNVSSAAINPCFGGASLILNTDVSVPNFLVNHSLSTETQPRNSTAQFCLETVVVSTGTYETGAANEQKWTIKGFY